MEILKEGSVHYYRIAESTSYLCRSDPMLKVTTSIGIKAESKTVWEILKDTKRYGEWNPFIKSIEGEMKVGSKIRVFLQPFGSKGMMIKPRLLQFSEDEGIRWIGRLGIPYLFDGEHSFKIIKNPDDTVIFLQEEMFRGLLVPFYKKSLNTGTKKGFEEMNRALKARSEKGR